jgi:nitrilase
VFGIVTAGLYGQGAARLLVARDGAIADVIDHTPRAASFFIDPTGEVISEVPQDEEGIAYAEIDLKGHRGRTVSLKLSYRDR